MASGSLWDLYRDEIYDVDDNVSDGNSFNYKTKIVGKALQILERLLSFQIHNAPFQIHNAKFYVPVVTLYMISRLFRARSSLRIRRI